MVELQIISDVASSSNSSSMVSSKKYEVFLSFRGEDTRMNFTSHLHEALKKKEVETFIDYELRKGDEISPALIQAIGNSLVSIVILSPNYASSKWCLEELSKILECRKKQGQMVIPVFYNIDPSHVRKQTGSYEQAFAKHKEESNYNKWKASLNEIANLAGWDSQNRTESELLKEIVGDVLQKLTPTYRNQLKGLVGIEDNYEEIESLLKIESTEVITIGIWGMGGIGKTTLATTLYARLSPCFEGFCFLKNVRENSSSHNGLEALHNKLFAKLLEIENHCFDMNFVRRKLKHKKVFIVLDDVDTLQQLEYLVEDYDLLGPGSRVIVTTRNKQIFSLVDEVYEVKELSYDQSLQLFCLTVFGEKQPKHGYEDLSRSVVSYCKGVPLALKVIGASLRRRSEEVWESELRKLQKIPNMQIHDILKLSYDGLDRSQKNIFLDIACLLKGENKNFVTSLLEACGFFAVSGIEVLLDKALITISNYNLIEMHDLIQQMGQEIVHQESIKDPGRRSRLWKHDEVYEVLKYNKETTNTTKFITPKQPNLVIVTTRNKQIFSLVDEVYEVKELSYDQSLQLFCLTVFGEKQPKHGYEDLSRSVVSYCKGVPLALKVIGASLRRRSEEVWESELRKLQKIPNMQIHNILKLSYDGLDRSQKNIFLDIACLLKGENKNFVTSLLEACGFFAVSGIEVLLDKALITISNYNLIEMHDLIQQMGQEIVHQESIKDPGRRSRLWKHDEVYEVLKYNKGTDDVEGIIFNLDTLTEDLCLSSDFLAKMPRFCLESLPSNFCAEQLVELDLSLSKVKRLWDGVQDLSNLKTILLYDFPGLVEIPDLSMARKLERISLIDCISLRELHPSITSLPKLTELELIRWRFDCVAQFILPVERYIEILKGYVKNKYRPEASIMERYIAKEAIEFYSGYMSKSEPVGIPKTRHDGKHFGKGLVEIPDLSMARKLERISLIDCISLRELHPSITSLPKLTELELIRCSKIDILKVHSKSLCKLSIFDCSSHLKEFSITSKEMTTLSVLKTTLSALPSSIWHNRKLSELILTVSNNFEKLSDEAGMGSITTLNHSECVKHNACHTHHNFGNLSSLEDLWLSGINDVSLIENIQNLSLLKVLYLINCQNLVSLPQLPPSLAVLRLKDLRELVSLPQLPPSLQMLKLVDCRELVSLPQLPPSLQMLKLVDCRKLVSLPQLPPSVTYVKAINCTLLGTDFTQRIALQHMLSHSLSLNFGTFFMFPGDHVIDKYEFQKAGNSITIPYLSPSNLCGFISFVILYKGSHDGWASFSVYQDDKTVCVHDDPVYESLSSDHILFYYFKLDDLSNNVQLKFEFHFYGMYISKDFTQERIKECGVFPVYAPSMEIGVGASNAENEMESSSQINNNESQPSENGDAVGIQVEGSNNKNGLESITQICENELQHELTRVEGSNIDNELEWEQLRHGITAFCSSLFSIEMFMENIVEYEL
ncbi:TMV resistance protein N [Cajanus cajan]|uniref:TMV resistance protein N n=1 Tax=Cajanus cajan TaxID=3821 RepID=UPI0010FB079E|nr:TMV resistance protein N [Cajanus cajan]